MPELRTIERARRDKRAGKAPTTQAGEFVREEIRHVREGKHGARSAKQAIAIGLSKARRAGVELPPPRGTRARTRRQARMRPAAAVAVVHRLGALARFVACCDVSRGQPRPGALCRGRLGVPRGDAAPALEAQRRERPLRTRGRQAVRTKGRQVRRAAARKAVRTRGGKCAEPRPVRPCAPRGGKCAEPRPVRRRVPTPPHSRCCASVMQEHVIGSACAR